MTTPLFERDGEGFRPTELIGGPWDPDHAHGGATAALVAHLVEEVPTLAPMRTVRLTLELVRPLSRDPLSSRVEVARQGRRVQTVTVVLRDRDGTVSTSAVALRIRTADTDTATAPDPVPTALGDGPDDLPAFDGSPVWRRGFFHATELRFAAGSLGEPGPAAAWIRLRVPVVDDEPITPLSRVAAAGDFGNGVGAPLPMDRYLYINPDLTVAVDRHPVDEWVGISAHSTAGADGIGRTVTAMADRQGRIGTALQSLYVDRR